MILRNLLSKLAIKKEYFANAKYFYRTALFIMRSVPDVYIRLFDLDNFESFLRNCKTKIH